MSRYIEWDDVINRYPALAKGTNAEEVSSAHIFYAEYELDGALSNYFTTPFSSNNITAKDLSIDLVYARMANLKYTDADKFRKAIQVKIDGLANGSKNMMTTGGDLLATVGNTIWSSTKDYHNIFDHGDVLDMVQDQSQLLDEENDKL